MTLPNLSGLDCKKAANVGVGEGNTFLNGDDTDRSMSDYLPILYLLLIALYGEHLPGGIADFAGLVRYVNERGVQPVWAWILERDRMLRRAAAYQLGV